MEQQQQQQQMMIMMHNRSPLPSVPTEIEIMSSSTTTSTSSDHHHHHHYNTKYNRPLFPWTQSSSSPSVEFHDGCVTYRPNRDLRPQDEEHLLQGMSFTTEALTNAEDAENYYFYKDVDENNKDEDEDDDEYEGMMLPRVFSREEENENEYEGQLRANQMYFRDNYEDPRIMITTQPSSSKSPPPLPLTEQQQQQQDPPVGVENRLVVISQQERRHRTALEPEEYAYPREFTAFAIQSSCACRTSNVDIRSRRLRSDHLNPLTTLSISSMKEQPQKCGAVTIMTNKSKSSSSSHERYNGYQHCFVTVLTEHRFLMLYTFLSRHAHQNKIVVLFSTTQSLMYHVALLHRLKFNVRAIHDGMAREQVAETLQEFSRTGGGGLEEEDSSLILCMLDFQGHNNITVPSTTNWIIQFEPCTNPSEYIYQVGRISHDNSDATRNSRYASYNSSHSLNTGRPRESVTGRTTPKENSPRALLFITPNEYGFHRYFKAAQVKTYEYEIPRLFNVQNRLMKLLQLEGNRQLRNLSLKACHAYLFAYAKHEFGDIYNVKELDIEKVSLSFGFDKLPSEELLEGIQNGGGSGSGDYDDDDESGLLFNEKDRTKSTSWRRNPMKTSTSNSTSWMTCEKTWRHSDRHTEKMKVTNNPRVASIKPKIVVTR